MGHTKQLIDERRKRQSGASELRRSVSQMGFQSIGARMLDGRCVVNEARKPFFFSPPRRGARAAGNNRVPLDSSVWLPFLPSPTTQTMRRDLLSHFGVKNRLDRDNDGLSDGSVRRPHSLRSVRLCGSCSWPSTSTARSRSSSVSLCEVSYGMNEGAGCGGRQTLSAVAILLPTSVARPRYLSAPHDRRHHCHHLSAPPLRSMRISYIDSPTGSRSLDRRARSSRSPLISFLSSEIAIAPTEKHRRPPVQTESSPSS